ncbi:MAG: DUF222 domain-containing protein, partial [Jatrophihabitantaceae bacterium]
MTATEFDPDQWTFLPPLHEADLPTEPPPEHDGWYGVSFGAELGAVTAAEPINDIGTDLGLSISEGLAAAAPGLAEIARLGATELSRLDPAARVDALIAVRRQLAWLAGRERQLLALIVTSDATEQQWCVEEVGAALALSSGQARTRLAHAEQLAVRLPATMQALSDGVLTTEQAEAIVKASFVLPDELLPAYEARLLPHA